VCGNGLGFTLHVNVNLIMKFIYTLNECLIFIYVHVNGIVAQCQTCKYKNCVNIYFKLYKIV
jgi:hypothetical protein